MRYLKLLLIAGILSGCSTSIKGKNLEWAGVGMASGALLGQSRPGTGEDKDKNAILYGSLFGLGAILINQVINDPDKKIENLRLENKALSQKVELELQNSSEKDVTNFSVEELRRLKELNLNGKLKKRNISRWIKKGDKYVFEAIEVEVTNKGEM